MTLDRPVCQPEMTGERLRELRELAGLTQAEFAGLANYTQAAICQMETGARKIPVGLRYSIKRILIKHLQTVIATITSERV